MTSNTDAPTTVFLNLGNEETTYSEALQGGAEITWCADAQDEWDVEYTRSDLCVPLSKYRELKTLLEVAACPNNQCKDGVIPHQVAENEWEAEQCQWCYERSAALQENSE